MLRGRPRAHIGHQWVNSEHTSRFIHSQPGGREQQSLTPQHKAGSVSVAAADIIIFLNIHKWEKL
ncbi:hypothetical protein EYF80_052097 [Liparis tanakae]|uniref:Uncharacterized protein n=1 Tax=Liparis tanakae TaxID=230148 RepID=A0A4Z2F995_9TELE|nr:hypothetical protein EYF80_052097 [Liparis tanakae]